MKPPKNLSMFVSDKYQLKVGKEEGERASILQFVMVDAWWSLLGAAIPAVIAGKAFRMKQKHAEEERIKSARGREKSSDDIFVCERVCTSKRMLKKVGAFSKDPIPDTCVTVCGVSELDACSDACARTVCVNQHQFPFFLEHWLLITVTAISVSKLGSLNGVILLAVIT
ncbi:hypothetical protein Godav_027853 [Gossypium davidsonii]|uniref:Uncharacterized protein n=1 Tax=Gossypium davidsonii TaxID=34287 RepID=A0A7J8RYW9_GOSDV|nr:hypothetical protein [Gossypium davidsonii]